MKQHILVIGAGFGGLWTALSATRLFDLHGQREIAVTVLAPQAELRVRPRFYEPNAHQLAAPLGELFDAVGVDFIKGAAQTIDVPQKQVGYRDANGALQTCNYDKLVLATGSGLALPNTPGVAEHAFNVDQIEQAVRLENHLKSLAERPYSRARNTVVVAVDEQGVTLADGQRIDASTVVWTTGVRASSLTEQIPAERDHLGRLHVDAHLQVLGQPDIFATGDVAYAASDDIGNHALMTCQHAISLGRHAGNNVAAQILGVEPMPYSQPKYVTCLDLGAWGAVYTEGWDRQVKLVREEGKALKTQINTQWIYPPAANREAAWAAADPLIPVA